MKTKGQITEKYAAVKTASYTLQRFVFKTESEQTLILTAFGEAKVKLLQSAPINQDLLIDYETVSKEKNGRVYTDNYANYIVVCSDATHKYLNKQQIRPIKNIKAEYEATKQRELDEWLDYRFKSDLKHQVISPEVQHEEYLSTIRSLIQSGIALSELDTNIALLRGKSISDLNCFEATYFEAVQNQIKKGELVNENVR